MHLPRVKSKQMDVRYMANLARIELSDEECDIFQGQLDTILSYIKKLSDVNVEGIEPTAHATPAFDYLRGDIPRPGLGQEDFLRNIPESALGQVRVPKMVDT